MRDATYLLVDTKVLPDVYIKVVEAKRYLSSGTASTAAEAARLAGISRSAYYKYKDSIYPYVAMAAERIITIHAVLQDKPGVLMSLISSFYNTGANILTVNQNIPVSGAASVSVSASIEEMQISIEEFLNKLKSLDGVQSIESITGE